MKNILITSLVALVLPIVADFATRAKPTVEPWGAPVDPAGDCEFKIENNKLRITVPGTAKAHDLSAEMRSMSAPRVLQPVSGDFVIQVKVDGEFNPGGESSQSGRSGYTGAGLVVFADENNFVRLERATLHWPGSIPRPYTNFEIRVNGRNQRFGTTGDFRTQGDKPIWLRLERKGDQMLGSMSHDGENWSQGTPKKLDAKIWNKPELSVGVAAISTSKKPFTPEYFELSIEQESTSNIQPKEAE